MIKLRKLGIPAGWEMVLNKFLDIDITKCEPNDKIWLEFTQDILYIRKKNKRVNIVIDLGWYPENEPTGVFRLCVIMDSDWFNPKETFISRNHQEIAEKIEEFLIKYSMV